MTLDEEIETSDTLANTDASIQTAILASHDGPSFVLTSSMREEPDRQTFQIIGAAMEVHRHLPRGMYEQIYGEALALEFVLRQIPFRAQCPLRIDYKGQRLTGVHHMDFVCFNAVVIEVKAVSALSPADQAQLMNYLAMAGIRRGLLLNFGAKSLESKRRVIGD